MATLGFWGLKKGACLTGAFKVAVLAHVKRPIFTVTRHLPERREVGKPFSGISLEWGLCTG